MRGPRKQVIEWLNRAKITGISGINLYYKPFNEAFFSEVKPRKLGNIVVGYEWGGYLFAVRAGSGDCEENLIRLGKI
jgi:hypothetical protein